MGLVGGGLAFGVALVALRAGAQEKIAVLSNHDPTGWTPDAGCTRSTDAEVLCNLEVYEAAIWAAAAQGADLVLLPEGYGLTPSMVKRPTYELFDAPEGSNPCASASDSPAQRALSCAARAAGLTVVANVFVNLPNGTRRIADIVFGPDGGVLAHYDKHALFPLELIWFSPGPARPTSFRLNDRTYGLVICYEGIQPTFFWGSWHQFDALNATGADVILWSIGGMVDPTAWSATIARRYGIPVVAAEGGTAAAFVDAAGASFAQAAARTPLRVPNYTAAAAIHVATLPPPRCDTRPPSTV